MGKPVEPPGSSLALAQPTFPRSKKIPYTVRLDFNPGVTAVVLSATRRSLRFHPPACSDDLSITQTETKTAQQQYEIKNTPCYLPM